jgi:hypothetical protein
MAALLIQAAIVDLFNFDISSMTVARKVTWRTASLTALKKSLIKSANRHKKTRQSATNGLHNLGISKKSSGNY